MGFLKKGFQRKVNVRHDWFANPDYYIAGSTCGYYRASALNLHTVSSLHYQLS